MAAGSGGDGQKPAARTRKRDLHKSKPYWAATPGISVPAIRNPAARHYDVVIAGAGISGALMAEALTAAGHKVLVVDRRPPVRGSTLASTAMIQHEIDLPLHELARSMGQKAAGRAWRRSVAAVQRLTDLALGLGIDCAMQPKKALYLAGDDYGSRALRAEAEMRVAEGIAATYLGPADLQGRFGIDRTGAILSEASASANPAQLAAGLLRVAVARGAEIASPVELTDMQETSDGIVLATSAGRLLSADHAVFCTGYEFLPQMQNPAHSIISTWALASEPGIAHPAWLDDFLVWEASDPYLYLRTAPRGRIIAGGEDEDSPEAYKDPAKLAAKARRIAAKIEALLGLRIGTPAHVWAAPFGNTRNGLPIIDRVPGLSRAHAVMGFGGNGITFSAIAAEIVSARIGGKPDPDEDLFRFPD